MLETGFKQIIVNSADDIAYNRATGELQLFGSATVNDAFKKGHINIPAAQVSTCSLYEARDEVPGRYLFSLATGSSSLSSGDVVTVSFDFSTYKSQGEFNNLRIDGSDILTFQVVLTAGTVNNLAARISDWFAAAENADILKRYHVATCTSSTNVLTMTMTTWSVYPVSLVLDDETGSATGVTYTLATDVAPEEGVGLPILMEEKVQNNTFGNKSLYALGANAKINPNTRYNVLNIKQTFVSNTSNNAGAISGGANSKVANYIIYIDEDIALDDTAVMVAEDHAQSNMFDTAVAAVVSTAVESTYSSVTPAQEAALVDGDVYLHVV